MDTVLLIMALATDRDCACVSAKASADTLQLTKECKSPS